MLAPTLTIKCDYIEVYLSENLCVRQWRPPARPDRARLPLGRKRGLDRIESLGNITSIIKFFIESS